MSDKQIKFKTYPHLGIIAGLILLFMGLAVGLMTYVPWQAADQVIAGIDGTPHYLPMIRLDPSPTPTLIPTPPPVPQFLKNIALPSAQCPNSVGFNPIGGYVYVPNNFSSNVSVFKDASQVTTSNTGFWPTYAAAGHNSPLTYVTVLHAGVTVFNGPSVIGVIPRHYEPYNIAANPVNGYVYATDLDSTVQIINGTSLVTNLSITDPEAAPPHNGAGWLRSIAIDPHTGLVYVSSWSHGKMYVIDDTTVIANYRAGWGIIDMALDAARGYIYLAHSDPDQTYPHNISVFNINTQTFTYIDTDLGDLNNSRAVAIDPTTGYAYVTNPAKNNVSVLLGNQVIATLPAGTNPWDVAVHPNSGYVFVTNRDSNDITIYKGLTQVATIPSQGLQPFAVGIDTTNNDIYIANRGDEYALFQCRDASVTILR